MNHLRLLRILSSTVATLFVGVVAGCGAVKDPQKDAAGQKQAVKLPEVKEKVAGQRAVEPDRNQGIAQENLAANDKSSPAPDLLAARKNFKSQFRVKGPAPQTYENEKPPEGVKEVTYESGNLKLKGWLAVGPKDEKSENAQKKKPAVVFLHGGFSFSKGDWEDAEPFLKAGYVLFMPTLRGENGNPGFYESFLGEVDDAAAAGRFVAALPEVDPQRIFVSGHSAGGVLTCLVSMIPSVFKAAAPLDGCLVMQSWAEESDPVLVPYDRNKPEEIFPRNPLEFVESVRCPIRLYASPDGAIANLPFAVRAQQLGKTCELVVIPGDHQSMVAPAIQKTIAWFQEIAP